MMLNKVHAANNIRTLQKASWALARTAALAPTCFSGNFFSPTLSEGRRKSVSLGLTADVERGGLN